MKNYIVFITLIVSLSLLIALIIQLRECIRAKRAYDRKLACQIRERDQMLRTLKRSNFEREIANKANQTKPQEPRKVPGTEKKNTGKGISLPPA